MTPLSIQQDICRLYPTTRTEVLVATYGVSNTTIRNIVKRHGGIIKPVHEGNHKTPGWTPAEDAIIREHFATCSNIQAVMPRLPGRTYNAIRTRANARLGVQMKKFPQHNRAYFDIPNEVNSSIAGFIAADGCVSDIGRLSIRLASKDKDHLVKIVQLLNFTGKIYNYTNTYDLNVKGKGSNRTTITNYKGRVFTCSVQIGCPELCQKLKEHWNITPRKTYTLVPPNLTDDRLIMAYLSGMIDGDGWIVASKTRNSTQYSISLMGTKELMGWVKATFDRLIPGSNKALLQATESENIYVYRVSGVKSYWLGKMFLALDVPRLERKWGKLRELIARVESGSAFPRFKTVVIRDCPSDTTLATFGLTQDKQNLLKATSKPLAPSV